MQRFFRLQTIGISFDDMKKYDSIHSDDSDEDRPGGLAACDHIELRPNFGGAWGAYGDDDGEVVIYDGYTVEQIYDGALTEPCKEIARFTKGQWRQMVADGTAWDWE